MKKSIQNLADSLNQINGKTSTTTNELEKLEKEVEECKNKLLELNTGSQEYIQTLSKLKNAQSKIDAVNEAVKNSTAGLKESLEAVNNIAKGVTAGFTLFKSTAQLLGVENDKLADTMVRLQSGMALVQSLTALSNEFKSLSLLTIKARVAFAAFNATLRANPIGAVVTAVAALTAGLVYFIGRSGDSKKSVDDLKESYDDFKTTLSQTQIEYDNYLGLLKAAGASEQEILYERAVANSELGRKLKAEYARIKNELRTATGEQREILLEHLEDLRKDTEAYNKENRAIRQAQQELQVRSAIKTDDELLDQQKQTNAKAIQAAKKAADDRRKIEENLNKSLEPIEAQRIALLSPSARLTEIDKNIEKNQALVQEYTKNTNDLTLSLKDRLEASESLLATQKKISTLEQERLNINNQIAAQNKLESDQDLERKNRKDALAEAERQLDIERQRSLLTGKELENFNREQLEAEIKRREDDKVFWDSEIERLELALQKDIEDNSLRILLIDDLIAARENSFELEKDIFERRKELRDQDLADEEKVADEKKKIESASLNITKSYLDSASTLLGENTAAGKAASVASATIQTYEAATGAYASMASIPIVGPALGAAAAGAAIAAGLANVKSILKVNVDGAADTSTAASTSTPSIPDIETPVTPTYDYQDAYDDSVFKDNREVLVVEEFDRTQERVVVSENEAGRN